MRHVISITLNELRVSFGKPVSLVFLIGLPLAFTVVLGLAMGTTGGPPTIRVDAVDLDGSALSARLVGALRDVGGETLTICTLTDSRDVQPEECDLAADAELAPEALAAQRLEDGVTYAAVIVPDGFGARLLAGEDVTVAYRANADLSAPMFIRQSVDAAIRRVSGSVVAARLSADAARTVGALSEPQRATFFNDVYQAAEKAWQEPPVVLSVEATVQEEESGSAAGFSQSAPGMACMFVMVNVLGVAQALVASRQNWTFQRLMVMPVPRWAIVAGKVMAYYLAGLCAFLIILGVGGLVGVRYGDSPLAALAVAVVYTLTVSAMGLAFATFARTLGQASALSTLIGIVLAPLGGAWWPLDVVPQAMNVAGHIVSPIAWAMDAFNGMIYYGKGLGDILPYLGILLMYAAVFFAVGVLRFKYE